MAADPLRIGGLIPRPEEAAEYPDLFDTLLEAKRVEGITEGRRLERERILKLRILVPKPSRDPWWASAVGFYWFYNAWKDGRDRALQAYRKRIRDTGGER